MAKKNYSLCRFYTDALFILEKYKIQIAPEHRFSVDISKAFHNEKGAVLSFEIWYSNNLPDDQKRIASATERNPELALINFEADLMDRFDIPSNFLQSGDVDIVN